MASGEMNITGDPRWTEMERRLHLFATAACAFAMPFWVRTHLQGKLSFYSEMMLLSEATILGAAIGFTFFCPWAHCRGELAAVRRVVWSSAVGMVAAMIILRMLRIHPLAPQTQAALFASSLVGLLCGLVMITCERSGQLVTRGGWTPQVSRLFFFRGVISAGIWVSLVVLSQLSWNVSSLPFFRSSERAAFSRGTTAARNLALIRNGSGQGREVATKAGSRQSPRVWQSLETQLLHTLADGSFLRDVTHPWSSSPAVEHLPSSHSSSRVFERPVLTDLSIEGSVPRNRTAREVVAEFERLWQADSALAIEALDAIDPSSQEGKALRKDVASKYLWLAKESGSHEGQLAGIRGMVRWGGKFAAPYFAMILESQPAPEVAAELFEALADLRDPCAIVVANRLVEVALYAQHAKRYLEAVSAQ